MTSWDQNMRSYYHFTSLKACEKIISTGKIRLSRCNMIKKIAVETMALYSALQNVLYSDLVLKNGLLKIFEQKCS